MEKEQTAQEIINEAVFDEKLRQAEIEPEELRKKVEQDN